MPRSHTSSSLLDTGMYADATVIGADREWKVHKTILCPRSTWFAKAFQGDGEVRGCLLRGLLGHLKACSRLGLLTNAVTSLQTGQTGVVNLYSIPSDDVDTLIKYIYSGCKYA